jgi:hypothetical protein
MTQWYYENLELGKNCGECVAQQYCLGSNAVAKGVTDADIPYPDFRNIQQGLNDCPQGTSTTFVSPANAEAMGRAIVPQDMVEALTVTRYNTPAFQEVNRFRSLLYKIALYTPARARVPRGVHNGILAKKAIKTARLQEY